jgi:hypothetical protein
MTTTPRRVLISHPGWSGKQGAVRGDVVTHVDGLGLAECAATTVSDLVRLLHKKRQQRGGTGTIMLTLNAERSVAEALRRRADAIAEM